MSYSPAPKASPKTLIEVRIRSLKVKCVKQDEDGDEDDDDDDGREGGKRVTERNGEIKETLEK